MKLVGKYSGVSVKLVECYIKVGVKLVRYDIELV